MKVNDFVGIEKIKSGTGIELTSNAVISGGAYMPSMLLVENYDTEDWSPVFNPVVVKSFNMTIGYKATVTPDIENSIAFGNNVVPITSNTIQLGNWAQQVLTIQEGAYRLDERDMVDISESVIGLSFIDALKPIKYRDQFRESSIDEKYPLPHPINEPEPPNREVYRIEAPDGSFYIDEVSYGEAVTEYERKLGAYQTYRAKLEGILAIRKGEYAGSGSVKGDYYNYAFKPTELLSAASAVDSDFKPVVGDITQYYKPTQLIVPLVKSVQEEHLLIKDLRTDVTDLQTRVEIIETNIFSDMRLKTEKISLQDREKNAALEIKESIGLYKLLSSVDEKGDAARYHVGVYAQEVIAILEKYDLDPLNRYSFIGKDNHEKSEEDGYYNIRLAELALFLIAAL